MPNTLTLVSIHPSIFKFTALMFFLLLACSCGEDERAKKCLKVKASAYNSLPYQTRPSTSGDITAWGDRLHDSLKSIAISRDLLDSGLTYGTMVTISGFEGEYVVNDKMNRRYKNHIDIHMGKNVKAARKFGRKSLGICWVLPLEGDSIEREEGL